MPHPDLPIARRIQRMESVFDALLHALDSDPHALRTDPALSAMLEELTAYYCSPQWLADYDADQLGLLPPDLKRGVLSQDGVYDLLSSLSDSPKEPD